MGQGDPGRKHQAGVIRAPNNSVTPVPRMRPDNHSMPAFMRHALIINHSI